VFSKTATAQTKLVKVFNPDPRRVKVWTQDAVVMVSWKDPKILLPETPMAEQTHFLAWVKDNVDFGVRARRVN